MSTVEFAISYPFPWPCVASDRATWPPFPRCPFDNHSSSWRFWNGYDTRI